MNNYFDQTAKEWDLKPGRFERAQKFAEQIRLLTEGKKIRSAMEFGAGTGAVSFCLKNDFREIVLIDDSPGMVGEMKKKIDSAGVSHMRALTMNLLNENYTGRHDLIYSLMVLHHIHDVRKIFMIFLDILNPGGLLVIGDLATEDGSFHAELSEFEGHCGFDMNELSETVRQTGFGNIRSDVFYHTKKIINSEEKTFQVFILKAERPE